MSRVREGGPGYPSTSCNQISGWHGCVSLRAKGNEMTQREADKIGLVLSDLMNQSQRDSETGKGTVAGTLEIIHILISEFPKIEDAYDFFQNE